VPERKGKTDDERIREILDDIVPFALTLPDAVESTSYGMPAIKRGKRWIFGLRKDDVTLSLSCSFEERARLLKAHPDMFFITDHYLDYPAVVVNLAKAKKPLLRAAVVAAWDAAAPALKKPRAAAPKPSSRMSRPRRSKKQGN
jgi:hypothetical protein